MTITLEQAKALEKGNTVYHVTNRNTDGTAQRWTVNGKVKTWKRDPSRVEIPIKSGMYGFDYLTENDLDLVSLEDMTLYVESEIYPVREINPSAEKGWYEYKVKLLNRKGEILDEWDSINECYEGFQRLTFKDCQQAIKTIKADVANGKANEWFTIN